MYQKLSSDDIEATCRALLQANRRVTVRMVSKELRRRYNACGKSARVARILRELAERAGVPSYADTAEEEVARLRRELAHGIERAEKAEGRALLSEERERAHQDHWARRYAEKVDELDRQRAALVRAQEQAVADEHLRLRQRVAWLERENALLSRLIAEPESP